MSRKGPLHPDNPSPGMGPDGKMNYLPDPSVEEMIERFGLSREEAERIAKERVEAERKEAGQ